MCGNKQFFHGSILTFSKWQMKESDIINNDILSNECHPPTSWGRVRTVEKKQQCHKL